MCLAAQSCLILCDAIDCRPPGSSVHGILQARILEELPFLPPGGILDPGIKPASAVSGGELGAVGSMEVHGPAWWRE